MKKIILLFCVLYSIFSQSQEKCNIRLLKNLDIHAIDSNDLKCLAINSNKKNTLFFTFGIWCEPCRLHLPNAIKFAKENDINFYVLLMEAEEDIKTIQAFDYIKKIGNDIKIVIIKDETYGVKRNNKNKKFLTDITPKEFENIDDYSKYILLNNKGEILKVTNWKDNKGNDWRDDTNMIKKCLLPLL
jgi:thiol-disulfide isomerase/thioredoxin